MTFDDLVRTAGKEPVFRAALLEAGDVSAAELRVQLSWWVNAGKLIQLRRGVYTLAPPHRQVDPHPFLVAQTLRRNSYVSLQSALAYYGLIPEHVAAVTCITTGRTEELRTDLGSFVFRHVATRFFFGYRQTELVHNQRVFVATPEKALLDLIYLTRGGEREGYLRELRLHNLETLNEDLLSEATDKMGKPKLKRALRVLHHLTEEEGSSHT
jgi:predicted transcriptional regulator of viral defense system